MKKWLLLNIVFLLNCSKPDVVVQISHFLSFSAWNTNDSLSFVITKEISMAKSDKYLLSSGYLLVEKYGVLSVKLSTQKDTIHYIPSTTLFRTDYLFEKIYSPDSLKYVQGIEFLGDTQSFYIIARSVDDELIYKIPRYYGSQPPQHGLWLNP